MKTLQSKIALALACAALAGCTSYQTLRYSSSTDNLLKLKALQSDGIAVGKFTSTPGDLKEITCRQLGVLVPPDGRTFADYVANAFQGELLMADKLRPASALVWTGHLDVVDANAYKGSWNLALTLKSSNGASLQATEEFQAGSSFMGETACLMLAQGFMPAVQNLITNTLRSPALPQLTAPNGRTP